MTKIMTKIMTKEDLLEVREQIDKTFLLIDDIVSNHEIDMIDLAYPSHEGGQDDDVVSEMMSLLHSTNNLSVACNVLAFKLTQI